MRKPARYVIFPTKWGYFGMVGSEKGLLRTALPTLTYEKNRARLLQNLPLTQFDPSFLGDLQSRITAYFAGSPVDFSPEIPLDLAALTPFQNAVLTACRCVEFGRTTTYGRLAESIARPKAARSVGNALARNPLPLIVPCHRVLAAGNELGGFSAPGGTPLKQRLLSHERISIR